MKVTCVGAELLDLKTGDLRWCLDFRDMGSPAVIFLSDAYGNRNTDSGGFILCPLYGRKTKAFRAASGTTNSTIIASLVCTISQLFNLMFQTGLDTQLENLIFAVIAKVDISTFRLIVLV